MKVLALFLIALIGYLGYDIWFGRNGVEQYESMSKQYEEASKTSKLLEQRNQALEDEISDLKHLVVEELARSELGMVKKSETFYRVIDKDNVQNNRR